MLFEFLRAKFVDQVGERAFHFVAGTQVTRCKVRSINRTGEEQIEAVWKMAKKNRNKILSRAVLHIHYMQLKNCETTNFIYLFLLWGRKKKKIRSRTRRDGGFRASLFGGSHCLPAAILIWLS